MKNIVIIDDEEDAHLIFDMMFDEEITAGLIKIKYFTSGIDCMQWLSKIRFNGVDAIITDINMPEMNGVELVREIRANGFRGDVYFVSAYDPSTYEKVMKELKVVDYFIKPIDFKYFRNSILHK